MDRVIRETMRHTPTVPFLQRSVVADTVVAGRIVPAGAAVLFDIDGMHRRCVQQIARESEGGQEKFHCLFPHTLPTLTLHTLYTQPVSMG